MWQLDIQRWNLNSGGPGSGVYVTHDGGATWTKIAGHGLPAADYPIGKVAVGIAPSNPNRVYALVQDDAPGLYRSDDRGATWQLVNQSHVTDERSPYYTRFAISPDDENLLYFPSVSFSMSRDGGTTVFQPGRGGRRRRGRRCRRWRSRRGRAARRTRAPAFSPRAATTTTSGSIRPTRIASWWPTTPA